MVVEKLVVAENASPRKAESGEQIINIVLTNKIKKEELVLKEKNMIDFVHIQEDME